MYARQVLTSTVVAVLASIPAAVRADEVRYYEKDGVTYCETRRVVQQQVPETRMEQRAQTVYSPQNVTGYKSVARTYWTPVTEYETKPVLVGRWNPFVQPYWEYQTTPHTRWEQRSDVVNVPVSTQQLIAQTQTTTTPVTIWRTVDQEVITRVAVSARPANSAATIAVAPPPVSLPTLAPVPAAPSSLLVPVEIPQVARRDTIGGVSQLQSDPPRQGPGIPTPPSTLRR
jgi:hypothetical protein